MGVLCQILINRPAHGIHYGGGTVCGVVKYAVDHPMKLKDVVLSFKGNSYCSWTDWKSDEKSTTYKGREEHVSQMASLRGILKNKTLPAGTYEHKFLFTLPKNIPSSFKRPTGHVTYKILFEFKKKGIFSFDKKFRAKIPVHNFLDPVLPGTAIIFGVDKAVLKPFTFGRHKIHLKAEIANAYIKPGGSAQLKFEINNNSNMRIKCIRAELVSTTIFTAKDGKKSTSTERIGGCMAETKEISPYQKASMVANVPTKPDLHTVQYSKVVSHEYKILVSVVVPWYQCNAKVSIPVLIGWREGEHESIQSTKNTR